MSESPLPTVAIFGMGLLGGSIALGLRERGLASTVHAFDLDPSALAEAQRMGAADVVHHAIGPWVAEIDVGILAVPVGALEALADTLQPWCDPASRWIDIGSVKGPIVDALETRLPHYVGTHPMAGLETAGMKHAYAGLVQNAVWVVTPTERTAEADLAHVEQWVTDLGAYPYRVEPHLHDRLVARVSHVPYLLAVGLNLQISEDPAKNALMFLAAGGFRDLTRVASGGPEMSRDMVRNNRVAVREALADLQAVLGRLAEQLDDGEALLQSGMIAKDIRDALPVVRRTLLPRVFDLMVAIEDRPLELARLTTTLGTAGVNIRDIEVLKIRGTGGEAIRVGLGSSEDQAEARTVLEAAGYRLR
ncbi:MAG: prephenate dehydrogenase [Myxococcota bacterium]